MKAKELIAFLQQYPEADVMIEFGENNEEETSASSLRYVPGEKLGKRYPDGLIYIGENKHF